MDYVLTLISPTRGGLSVNLVDQALVQLQQFGAIVSNWDYLSEGEACDIPFSNVDPKFTQSSLRGHFSGTALDVVIQPANGRRKKLLIADMDSTIVTSETLDELAEYAGLKDRISDITTRAMDGEILFRDALTERVRMLAGLDAGALDKIMDRISYSTGAKTLVRTMSANGAFTALASGGFRYLTKRVKEAVGFDFEIGTEIEITDGKLTGQILGEIVTKAVKREILISLAADQDIDIGDTLAVGDGANDLPMLIEAGAGVAYHAKPVVVASTPYRIDHAGLDALLFMQGYRREEFVG